LRRPGVKGLLCSATMVSNMHSTLSLDRFSELVGAIYEAPLAEPPWDRQLALLGEAMAARDAILILRQPSDVGIGVIFSAGSTQPASAQARYYAQRVYTLDPFVNLPPNQPVLLSEVIDEATLRQHAFFQLAMAPFDLLHILGIDILDQQGLRANLRFTRTASQPPFGAIEKNDCALLLPHICRALRTHNRISGMESERSVYADAMTQLAVAAILLDEHRQVIRTNRLADHLLQGNNAVYLVDGRLHLAQPHHEKRLRQLVKEVADAQRQGVTTLARAMLIERAVGGSQLSLVVRAMPQSDFAEGATAPTISIFIADLDQPQASSAELLTELFGLTPTEARLSARLADGMTVESASAEMDISPYTARAHLRSIFSKTGVSRQAQLVRLVLKSVASLG